MCYYDISGMDGVKMETASVFCAPLWNYINQLCHIKLLKNYLLQSSNQRNIQKCLPSAVIATVSISTILLTRCGITARSLRVILKFWPGYLHLSPRYDTTTFKPVGSTRWETGSYKPGNIRIGSAVSVRIDLIVEPYFVMEVRGLASPILGKRIYFKKEGHC